MVVDEPSIVAINRRTGETIAVGNKAMQMHEKTHEHIKTIRPLKDGVIADFQVTEKMLQHFIRKVHPSSFFRPSPRVVICVPCGSTQVERRAIRESAICATCKTRDIKELPRESSELISICFVGSSYSFLTPQIPTW